MRRKQLAIVGCLCIMAGLTYVFLHRRAGDVPAMYFFSGANMSDVIALVHDPRLRLSVGGNRAYIIEGERPADISSSAAPPRLSGTGDDGDDEWLLDRSEDAKRQTPAGGSPRDGPSFAEGRDAQRLAIIKSMMDFAWSNYEQHAWGRNELAPMSGLTNDGPLGGTAIGLTIVDSLDTLYLMGMTSELARAKQWCVKQLPKRLQTPVDVSAFEFNIRVVGGFLSMYALTGEKEYKELALIAAEKLMPIFRSPSGIPYSLVNLQTSAVSMWTWASGGAAILAEAGSFHLEFAYLSRVEAGEGSGAADYVKAVEHVRETIDTAPKVRTNLYTNFIDVHTGQFTSDQTASLGALGDSFYEYLLKSWLLSGKTDRRAKRMYYGALQAMRDNDVIRKSPGGLTYAGIYRSGFTEEKMEHLACFSGGLVALGAEDADDPADHMDLAEALALTCRESYARSAVGLGPEAFSFARGHREAVAGPDHARQYMLRPELVETYFVLWRLTHNLKYRAWAWDVVLALQNYSRVAHGFSGLNDVYEGARPVRDDSQPSYFLAETLKYLYLTFESDDVLPLDQWVFNTEAHPLPVAPCVTLATCRSREAASVAPSSSASVGAAAAADAG